MLQYFLIRNIFLIIPPLLWCRAARQCSHLDACCIHIKVLFWYFDDFEDVSAVTVRISFLRWTEYYNNVDKIKTDKHSIFNQRFVPPWVFAIPVRLPCFHHFMLNSLHQTSGPILSFKSIHLANPDGRKNMCVDFLMNNWRVLTARSVSCHFCPISDILVSPDLVSLQDS